MKEFLCVVVAAASLSGCSTATPPVSAVPSGILFAYAVSAPTTVTYQFTDSSMFNIKGGAIGDIRATTRGQGTVEITLSPRAADLEGRVKITDLSSSFTNSAMGGTTTATTADVQGEALLTISPRGAVAVNQLPTISRTAQQVGIGTGFYRRFTVRLPAQRVQRGSTWTDTISSTEETGGIRSTVHDIVAATWARDTIVAGRSLQVITHSTRRTLEVAGTSEGVQIAQKLAGTATGYTLWDAQRNLLFERFEATDLSGTFDLPAMGLSGLPVTAQGAGRVILR
jgi:hypothetical protein